jgi:hypothetical protein
MTVVVLGGDEGVGSVEGALVVVILVAGAVARVDDFVEIGVAAV